MPQRRKQPPQAERQAKASQANLAGKLGRTGVAALSLAAVCKALPASATDSDSGQGMQAASPKNGAPRAVFVANDTLAPVPVPRHTPENVLADDPFVLAKLNAFQKPPLEEHLVEPDGSGSGTCSCNSVCSCVPVQTCSCNTVCTCHTVSSCAAYSSGGGGGGGGYGGYYAPCW